MDFGLYFFHNARELLDRGSGPYFYLPKTESHLEARLWNGIFRYAQESLDIPVGTIRASVLIETIPAAFEMEEILFELRDHASGLNAGRWDYLFSIIKTFRDAGPDFVLPDRSAVAEISRSQVWQWVHNNVRLDTGETVTPQFVRRILDEELAAIRMEIGDQAYGSRRFDEARQLFEQVALADDFADFLTLPAYAMVD